MVLLAKWGIVAKKGADKTRNGNNAAIQIAIGAYAHLGKSPSLLMENRQQALYEGLLMYSSLTAW